MDGTKGHKSKTERRIGVDGNGPSRSKIGQVRQFKSPMALTAPGGASMMALEVNRIEDWAC
jgi:hypothetical protein